MTRTLFVGLLAIAAVAAATLSTGVQAGERDTAEHYKSSYYRGDRGTQVRGYSQRRGGYSYTYEDTLNTYGNPRTQYGGTNLYRDPMLDRQTNAGPFDHGFFFDSGITARGGDSPYQN